ncbi:hypothetical protein K438DRAFT_1967243 [Mycena galopus ATCC 62051]|nr:hypothetical protein K438DRAFT_1967243 [Mycena galopus ATCC 62051]
MPSNRPNLPPAQPGTVITPVLAMVYPALADATLFSIPVLPVGHAHYPLVEVVMQDSKMQGYVHDVVVEVWHKDMTGALERSRFRCFFRRHKKLPVNLYVDPQEKTFRGDLVVMRAASTHHMTNVVSLGPFDRVLTDFLVESMLPRLRAFQKYQIPVPMLLSIDMAGSTDMPEV